MEGLSNPNSNQLQGYIQLKIIEGQINICFRKEFLPGMFLVFGISNVICSYFCVLKIENLFQSVENVFFFSVFVEGVFFILFVGGLCGMVNKKSEIMLNRLKCGSLDRVPDRMVFRKRVGGCSPIKVKLGSNFVDILTPLRMIVLCIKGTVRLLLLR